jgi:energy-coupling factor transporter ATP-binding protein EcfA2
MMTFRKLAAASAGKLIRSYFTENTPAPTGDAAQVGIGHNGGPQLDPGGRLTAYYTRRDSRASWRPDMPRSVAAALGIDPTRPPKDADLDRLFEAKRADTGEGWSDRKRKNSAYDLTVAPHKSVTLAAEFAATPAEAALIWNAIDRANDATMRYVAREIGWARKGAGGEEGAERGAVGWVSFRHHNARPTMQVQDGPSGTTYLADLPVPGDPHAHIHNGFFNLVVTDDGRIGSLDTKRLHSRVHEFGAYFQAQLADELRRLGIRTAYDAGEEAVMLPAIPQAAVDAFSKGRRQTVHNAKRFAKEQGLDWNGLSAERKFGMLSSAAVVERKSKQDGRTDREIWRDQAHAMDWHHRTVMENAAAPVLTDTERFDRAYGYAARHLAREFETAAVLDWDKVRLYAARGLIGTGIAGGVADIETVVALVGQRGIQIRGEHAALITGKTDEKVRVTNTVQVRIERTLALKARQAALDREGSLSPGALRTAIAASGLDFQSEPDHGAAQEATIYALGTGGRLSLLTGAAGSGKTTLLKPLVAAYQADTTYDAGGREVIGISTAWRQADALRDTGIKRTAAADPFLRSIEDGTVQLTRNTVLVIDEVSQVAPRPFLRLLELQAEHGFTIKALGDREQCQAIEAGDTIEILRSVLPKAALPELLTTVRQETGRGREIANLFRGKPLDDDASLEERQEQRLKEVKQALRMKRDDGTALLIGGDQDQVVDRIADLYMERRDILRAAGGRAAKLGVTISALTNEDAADISRAVRTRLKARGEIGDDERVFLAVDQRGETYSLPLATGDRVRLFRKTAARVDGARGFIGSNGDIVEILGWTESGPVMRNAAGQVGEVEWRRLKDGRSDRLLLGFGHALTVEAAQGITSGEHINALPRGTAGITAFKAYVAESRHVSQVYTIISEAAVFEAVKHSRALGDASPVTSEHLWDHVAGDMSRKPYKALGMDLVDGGRRRRQEAAEGFMHDEHRLQSQQAEGRKHGAEARAKLRELGVRAVLPQKIDALGEALTRNGEAVTELGQEVKAFLKKMRDQTADLAKRGDEAAQSRQAREKLAAHPNFSPTPY